MHEICGASVFIVVLNQIETGTKMVTVTGKNNSAHSRPWSRRKEPNHFFNRGRIQRVALFRPVEGQRGDVAADSDDAGHLFRFEGGHLFRSDAGRRSDLMPAT